MAEKPIVEFAVPENMGLIDVVLAVEMLALSGEGKMLIAPIYPVWRATLAGVHRVDAPKDIPLSDVTIRFVPAPPLQARRRRSRQSKGPNRASSGRKKSR